MRAAIAITDQVCAQLGLAGFMKNPVTLRELAELIDEQTGAPDMLAALTTVELWCEAFPSALNSVDREQVRAAIAKVTGAP